MFFSGCLRCLLERADHFWNIPDQASGQKDTTEQKIAGSRDYQAFLAFLVGTIHLVYPHHSQVFLYDTLKNLACAHDLFSPHCNVRIPRST